MLSCASDTTLGLDAPLLCPASRVLKTDPVYLQDLRSSQIGEWINKEIPHTSLVPPGVTSVFLSCEVASSICSVLPLNYSPEPGLSGQPASWICCTTFSYLPAACAKRLLFRIGGQPWLKAGEGLSVSEATAGCQEENWGSIGWCSIG